MRRLILTLATLLIPSVAIADINISNGSKYVGVRGVAWGASFNVTYILTPVSPEVGVCFYIINNNPTNAHPFTAQVFQTADGGALDFTNNQGKYSSILISGLPASVPASTTIAGFSGTTSAAQIAFKFSASGALGGAPDTADLFFVQTTSPSCGAAPSAIPVQGAVAEAVSLQTTNPLAIGGKTTPNNGIPNAARFVNVLNEGATDLCTNNCYGIMIGAGNLNVLNSFTGLTVPNTGPLAAMLFAQKADVSTSSAQFTSLSAPGGAPGTVGAGQANQSLNGLFVQNNGYAALIATQTITTNGQQPIFGPPWKHGTFDSCYFTVTTSAPTGTTPTLDVYVQSSNDGTNYTDRVHFAQITTTAATQKQYAGLAGQVTGFIPANMSTRTLAASTRVDGPIGGWLQFDYVIAGASASFTNVQFGTACH